MRIHQASDAIANQQCLEYPVAAHGGQIVGGQQRIGWLTDNTVEGDKHRRLSGHGF